MTRANIPDKERCASTHAKTLRRCSKRITHTLGVNKTQHANERSGQEIGWDDSEALHSE